MARGNCVDPAERLLALRVRLGRLAPRLVCSSRQIDPGGATGK